MQEAADDISMSVSSISKVYSRQRIFRQVNGEYLFETSSAAISLSRLFRSLKSTHFHQCTGKVWAGENIPEPE